MKIKRNGKFNLIIYRQNYDNDAQENRSLSQIDINFQQTSCYLAGDSSLC